MKNTESLFKEQMHEKLPEIIITDKNQTDFIPQPSTSAAPRNVKTTVPNKATGGGGAESSHGLVFHIYIVMLLLFSLKEESQTNLGFQFNIWLEKEGFGKFDDIVLQYNKPDGKRTLICVQCKHGEEKINPDGTRTVNNISAADFLSNQGFGLINYISSFVEIESKNIDCETYFVILTNRAYVEENCLKYPFFQLERIPDVTKLISLDVFGNACFKIKYNDELGDFLLSKIALKIQNVMIFTKKTINDFCDKFIYICDHRDLDNALNGKLSLHCRHNTDSMKNLKARLHLFVSEMYQRKIHPNQNDIINEFNGKSIYFKIPTACPQFTGRVKEIQQIKEALKCEKKGHNILDLLITGMAGMGKTQIVRKYIDDYKKNYKHIVWINAENRDSLENSYVELAKYCSLISNNYNDTISAVVKAIFSYFRREHTLFVFDNTNKVLLSKNDKGEYIYLPHYDQYKNNKFLIISQDQKWTTDSPAVKVEKFSEDDALVYLDASIKCSKKEKVKLASMFQYWPLALCLAVSYIKLETVNSLGLKTCLDVIETLPFENEIFLTHLPENHEMEPYTESLHSLWLLIRNKLLSEDNLSIEILYMLTFSYPDNFPLNLIKIGGFSESQVNTAVSTLQQNSIVTVNDYKISIHRTLQSVIKSSITTDIDLYESTLLKSSLSFKKYLDSMDPHERMKSLGNIHMVTFLRYICESNIDPQKYIRMANDILKKLIDSQDLRSYCETDGIFDIVLRVAKEKLGENYEETLFTLLTTASMLKQRGKFDDSLKLLNYLIKEYTYKFGENDRVTLVILYNKGSVLYEIGKYDEALSIYDHLLKEWNTEFDKNGHLILNCLNDKALVLGSIGKYEEALRIYNQIIEEKTQLSGQQNPSTLVSLNNKALVLEKMGKYIEALYIYDHVIEIETNILSDKHPSILISMSNKASVLVKMEEFEDALNIYNDIIEKRTEILGEEHPHTLSSINDRDIVLKRMRKKSKRCCQIF